MNTLYNVCHIIVLVLLLSSNIFLVSCTIAYSFNKASVSRIKDLRQTTFWGAVLYLLLNMGYYLLGIVLITKGDLKMNSDELIIRIASRMHIASVAFVVTALIITAVTVIAAFKKQGAINELKNLFSKCIVIAIIFWILAWLIV